MTLLTGLILHLIGLLTALTLLAILPASRQAAAEHQCKRASRNDTLGAIAPCIVYPGA